MKKFKIQSFLQKNLFKKNILIKMFSKFFTLFNMPKSTWKISFNQFKKKNIENYISTEQVKEKYKDFIYPVYPGEINFKGKLTMFDEWIYESKLEAKYAKLFKGLDVPFIQQPPPLPSSSNEWWRIDFLAYGFIRYYIFCFFS